MILLPMKPIIYIIICSLFNGKTDAKELLP